MPFGRIVKKRESEKMNPELEDKGFIIIKDFFSSEDISEMREISSKYFDQGGGFDNSGGMARPGWIADEKLSRLLELCSVEKLINSISSIIEEEVGFVGHNDLHLNRSVGWHKDRLNGKARVFEKSNPWSTIDGEVMKIFKVNIYLQDHDKTDDGLIVREGSHKSENMNHGRINPIRTKIGDVILFDQRITHKAERINSRNRFLICLGFGVKNIFFEEFERGTIFRQNSQSKQVRV